MQAIIYNCQYLLNFGIQKIYDAKEIPAGYFHTSCSVLATIVDWHSYKIPFKKYPGVFYHPDLTSLATGANAKLIYHVFRSVPARVQAGPVQPEVNVLV